jgi:hypothetical protein
MLLHQVAQRTASPLPPLTDYLCSAGYSNNNSDSHNRRLYVEYRVQTILQYQYPWYPGLVDVASVRCSLVMWLDSRKRTEYLRRYSLSYYT